MRSASAWLLCRFDASLQFIYAAALPALKPTAPPFLPGRLTGEFRVSTRFTHALAAKRVPVLEVWQIARVDSGDL
jgi:hypothetical protein